MLNNRYGNAIWTNHALDRLKQRRMSQQIAYQAFSYPDKAHQGKTAGTTEFTKTIDSHLITIIAKQNESKEWIILSCWVDPPYAGSIDVGKKEAWRNYQRANFWGKLWLTFKKQLGF